MPEPERYLISAHIGALPGNLETCAHGTPAATVHGTGHMGLLDRWDLITYDDGCTASPVGSPSTTTTT